MPDFAVELLVFDPGQMVGWAALENEYAFVGQGAWYDCRNYLADEIVIEATPYAAKLTFDTWPIMFEGMVRASIWPKEPLMVQPTALKAARNWYSLPRGHGLGRHAKDALTHLVGYLVNLHR